MDIRILANVNSESIVMFKMNSLSLALSLLLLLLAALANLQVLQCKPREVQPTNQVAINLNSDDWRQFHQLLYATKGTPLDPMKQTHEYLKRLKQIYEQDNANDKSVQVRLQKVSQMLDISDLNLANCHSQYFRELNKLIAYNQCYKLNIVPYMELHRARQFSFCGDKFYEQLEQAVSQLSGDDLRQIEGEDFFTSFPIVSSGELDYGAERDVNRQELIKQFLNFLERNSKVNDDLKARLVSTLGLPSFTKHYNELVDWTCGPYKQKLESELNELLDVGLDLFRQQNQTNKWLVYGYVCRTFTTNRNKILKDTHEAYFQRHCPRGINGRLRRRRRSLPLETE